MPFVNWNISLCTQLTKIIKKNHNFISVSLIHLSERVRAAYIENNKIWKAVGGGDIQKAQNNIIKHFDDICISFCINQIPLARVVCTQNVDAFSQTEILKSTYKHYQFIYGHLVYTSHRRKNSKSSFQLYRSKIVVFFNVPLQCFGRKFNFGKKKNCSY